MSSIGVKRLCLGEEYKPTGSNTIRKQWCDMPHHLLSLIADGLGLIDLLSFRAVCKDWCSASLEASAKVESAVIRYPWFLKYGDGHQCSLLTHEDKLYTLRIPELDGATCLASNGGWLLLFCQGSMFFFCPFSRARIDLPKFPFSKLYDYDATAAFSSPPTSQDCIVAVVIQTNELCGITLHLLFRGDNQWVKHDYFAPEGFGRFGLPLATYHDGTFHIFDGGYCLVTFVTVGKDIECKSHFLRPVRKWNMTGFVRSEDSCPLIYFRTTKYFVINKTFRKLGLEPDVSGSFSTCGTKIPIRNSAVFFYAIYGEKIQTGKRRPSRYLKGVWIQPRYFQISPDQSW